MICPSSFRLTITHAEFSPKDDASMIIHPTNCKKWNLKFTQTWCNECSIKQSIPQLSVSEQKSVKDVSRACPLPHNSDALRLHSIYLLRFFHFATPYSYMSWRCLSLCIIEWCIMIFPCSRDLRCCMSHLPGDQFCVRSQTYSCLCLLGQRIMLVQIIGDRLLAFSLIE